MELHIVVTVTVYNEDGGKEGEKTGNLDCNFIPRSELPDNKVGINPKAIETIGIMAKSLMLDSCMNIKGVKKQAGEGEE